jgi:alpha-L-fucosidase 2
MVRNLIAHNTLPNLFGNHPPMQLDGNFGITAGICEMLLQSHAGEIQLLPALPAAWPDGEATGLRARGGFEVDISWKAGRLAGATIRGGGGAACRVRWGAKAAEPTLPPGGTIRVDGDLRIVEGAR